jgi:acetyltransferase-like isoleucine patch superfamily enzyme
MSLHAKLARLRRIESRARAQTWRRLHPGIEVGRGVRVGRRCRLFLDPQARLTLADGCIVDDGTTIAVYGQGHIDLGSGSFVGHHCTLAARETIRVGQGAFLAELVSVRDHDHAVGYPPSSGRTTVESVFIGADAWIGAKVTVLRGAQVGEGTVVGANSVVRGQLPPRSMLTYTPGKLGHVRSRSS